ncbi:MAG: hypothetical protein B6D35_14265 [Candidatus Brocadia sp. UTAMX2]|jgi:signal transduction histidine kinase|nr:MAG: hypothetical protein B6D35_14265 [Candidatus Brocadia sp. UTAMX2]
MINFHKIFHPEKFNLLLYYTITSFVAIAGMSLVVGWIFPRMESKELVNRSEKYAHQFISHLNYEIYKDFLLPTLQSDKRIDLENNKNQLKKLDRIVRENLYGLRIKKLYLYDFEGHIIYSTIPEHIGFTLDRGINKNLDSAIRGKPASVLRLAGTIDSKGMDVVETLLESYYPFYDMEMEGRKKKQIGVLEIYQDMSDLKRQITKVREKAIIMTGSAMGILFFALFLIVFKAARIINMKTLQLIDSRNSLEQKVEERTFEIREAYKELQLTQRKLIQNEKLASIGTLTAGLAHEINNPLASIASCAEGIIERLKITPGYTERKNPAEKAALEVFPEYLKIICDETYRCKTIISNLLNFSRHSAPAFERIDVNQVVHDTLSVGQYQKGDHKIQLHLSPEACEVIGDPQQLKQVFLNLLINSLHATEESGGGILISTIKKPTVVQVVFQDAGVGIKREHLDKIFDPFFTTKATGKGTGLGLAICYGIIDVHNGRIEAFSEGPGTGATFTITLPLSIGEG